MTDIALVPLSALASLRTLNLLGNPLAFDRRHRAATIPYLHSNTSTVKVSLPYQAFLQCKLTLILIVYAERPTVDEFGEETYWRLSQLLSAPSDIAVRGTIVL